MMLFDTHAHLDDRQYSRDRGEMLQRARDQGVERIVNVGYDLPSSTRSLELAGRHDFIYAAVGIHPHDASDLNDDTIAKLKAMASHPKVVAIGETGLDYYRNLSPQEAQQQSFRRHISLARELGLPLIIHDRDAHGDILRVMQEEQVAEVGGILHCFSGNWEMARQCLEMNFYISFAGPVTFNNARRVQEIAAQVPLDRLLIETDAPYLTPEPLRGKRNESSYVFYVCQKIAELRRMKLQDLAQATYENGLRVFRIK